MGSMGSRGSSMGSKGSMGSSRGSSMGSRGSSMGSKGSSKGSSRGSRGSRGSHEKENHRLRDWFAGGEMMETYTPIRGMIICSGESGDYIKKSDYLKLKSAVSAHIKWVEIR